MNMELTDWKEAGEAAAELGADTVTKGLPPGRLPGAGPLVPGESRPLRGGWRRGHEGKCTKSFASRRESKRCSAASYPHPGLFPRVLEANVYHLPVDRLPRGLSAAGVLDGIPPEK